MAVFLGQPCLAAQCLYVSSYHKGYEWNDGIERGLESVLAGQCEIDRIYLDTKRNTDESFGRAKALEAYRHIEATRPDIIIAADDNASKYLVQPYLMDKETPVVFCGVNWNVDAYGYPYSNATGMVEVVPIGPLLDVITSAVGNQHSGIYLSSDVFTEHKDFARYKEVFAREGVVISGVFVSTLAEWEKAYLEAQSAGFVILGNNGGINDWDKTRAAEVAVQHARTLTVTNYDWMMPYAMFAMTKVPEEQGEWAAQVALSILGGEHAGNIPIIANRRWGLYANPTLLKKTGISLPAHIMHRTIKVGDGL